MTVLAQRWNVCLQDLTVEKGSLLHALLSEYATELDESIDIIGRMKERESLAQEREQDDATRPHVDQTRLSRALQQHFRGTETTGACAIGAAR